MLPVTILTGFLGSGKTTLLRRLLSSPWGERIGVLMNERGVAGIDGVGAPSGGFVELAQGCVCCVDQPDLVAALSALAARGNLSRVVLETSGLADPLPIGWAVARPELARLVALEAVVTVVDARNQADTRVEEWQAQVRCADVVVVSKVDLVDQPTLADVRAAVRAENPGARLLEGDDALLALAGSEAIFGPSEARSPALADVAPPLGRHGDFVTVTIGDGARYRADALEDLVSDLPVEVFRAKGIVRVEGDRWLSFQTVAGRALIDFEVAAPSHGESRMAFFGRRLDGAVVEARLAACRLPTATS